MVCKLTPTIPAMRRNWAVLGVTALVSACKIPSAQPTPEQLPAGSWIAHIAGATGASVVGDAKLLPLSDPGKFRVHFDLRSVAPTARFRWAVNTGRCNETAAVAITTPAVPQIDARPDRTAALRTDVALALDPDADYHVTLATVVHNPTEVITIACGRLTYVR